ncbi:hypothetical protein PFISCL1PPCAC_26900 [Pristionchus fissidentatus]|uniref:Major facilitator superfamily (MFS) profile domain-containing protein n=1 Tax=Pristionchus fissidentatus TaxID=1538716 RepID=A0AAV5WY06_9BILA|nr:hypothetical protein PFISCL1PPCAC_26900 [Pristionchus fissidentatus]
MERLKMTARSLRNYYRYVIVVVTFVMLGSLMIGPDVFTYAMVYMENNTTDGEETFRTYNDVEKNYLITAMAVGTLIGMYPFNWLFSRYGARFVILGAGILSTLSTFLVPVCLDLSLAAAIIIRILQGISYSADFGLVGLVVTNWSPITETAIILALLSSFTFIKASVQLPLAAYMLKSYGWRSIYYAIGGIIAGSTILWTLVYRDDPRVSPANHREIERIERGKEKKNEGRVKVPYKRILLDHRVHALWAAAFVDTTASIMLSTYSAKFYSKIGFDSTGSAIATSLPGYSFLIGKILTGVLSDAIKSISETTKIRVFTFISLQLSAFVLLAIALTIQADRNLQVAFQVIFQFLIGANVGAFYKGGVLMSGPYAFFVIGNVQLFKSLSSLIEPLLFNWIVAKNEFSEWQTFFYIHVGLLTMGTIIYFPFVTTENQYTKCEDRDDSNESTNQSEL